jgi:hypothetical protein
MQRSLLLLTVLLVSVSALSAQTLDTWVTSQGAMFEASVKQVIPGQVTFVLKDGREQPVRLTNLSERSRVKLSEALGLGSLPGAMAPAPAAPTTTPSPAPVTPTNPMATVPVDGSAIDVTDAAQLSARMGQPAIIVGTVKEVVTLGDAGHKLVKFDGSNFNLFISKQALDKSTDWVLDDLPGKRLQVSGKLESYRDAPQIRGNEPTQISRVQ